jgi:hypothetical protein
VEESAGNCLVVDSVGGVNGNFGFENALFG